MNLTYCNICSSSVLTSYVLDTHTQGLKQTSSHRTATGYRAGFLVCVDVFQPVLYNYPKSGNPVHVCTELLVSGAANSERGSLRWVCVASARNKVCNTQGNIKSASHYRSHYLQRRRFAVQTRHTLTKFTMNLISYVTVG